MLVTYAQIILVRNIVVGLNGVDLAIIEAARGMGMSNWQRLRRVELPLALPVILAGLRIATVTTIGIGAIAALINAGGLGRLLFDGVGGRTTNRSSSELPPPRCSLASPTFGCAPSSAGSPPRCTVRVRSRLWRPVPPWLPLASGDSGDVSLAEVPV